MYYIIKKVLQRATYVIFNSDEQRVLYQKYYNLLEDATVTIYNAIPENRLSGLVQNYNTSNHDRDKEFVFAGRFIKMKNVDSLVRAFEKMTDPAFKLILIGEGPLEQHLRDEVARLHLHDRVEFLPTMNQSDLYRRIAHCYAVVIPSWTDVSPHQAYECLALGIPFLITKENYLSIHDQIPEMINPHSIDDIADKMNALTDENTYKQFVEKLQKIEFNHPWSYVVEEHLKVFMKYNRLV
jgi:glycosyltransferase involved in cell wall biosynthesis